MMRVKRNGTVKGDLLMDLEIIRAAGCRCDWLPRTVDTGGDVKVFWELRYRDLRCGLHGVQGYREALDNAS